MKLRTASAIIVAIEVAMASSAHAQQAGATLEEVIVTAQRREESLLAAPVTVTAISGDVIEQQNVRTLESLTALVPGLEIEPDGPRTSIRLRGIATGDGSPAAENIAALHVDNVYISHRSVLSGYFFDVERVEVLQGPQGTLYGRNTAAGSLNIISRRPTQEREAAVEIDFGTYNSKRFFGMMNMPVADTLALRGAFQASARDGYFASNVDEMDDVYGRLGIQWDPTERVSFYTKLDYGSHWNRGNGVGIFGSINTDDPDNHIATWYDEDLWFDDSAGHPPDREDIDSIDLASRTVRKWGVTSELTVDFSANTQLIASYGYIDEEWRQFNVGLNGMLMSSGAIWGGIVGERVNPGPWLEEVLDVRFQGTVADQLDWTLGVFYWEDRTASAGSNPNGISFHGGMQADAESDAIYGQVTWTPPSMDRLHLTLGGRRTNDWKQWNFQVNLRNRITVGGSGGQVTREWDNDDFKVGIAWDLGDAEGDGMIYANASSGYRAGSWFPGPLPSYDPEFVDAFEIGWKGRLADDRLELAFNTYFYEYTDAAIQFDSFNTISQENEIGFGNLGNGQVLGANLSGSYLATDNDLVTFNLDYTDSEITSFDFTSALGRFPTDPNGNPIYIVGDVFDWTGLDMPNTIPLRLTLAWNRTFNLAGGATLDTRLQTVWADERFYSYRDDAQVQYESPARLIDSYATFDFNLNYQPLAGDWHVGFYALNLTDEAVPLSVGSSGLQGTLAENPPPNGDRRYITGRLRAPRTVGVRFGVDF